MSFLNRLLLRFRCNFREKKRLVLGLSKHFTLFGTFLGAFLRRVFSLVTTFTARSCFDHNWNHKKETRLSLSKPIETFKVRMFLFGFFVNCKCQLSLI